MLFAKNYLPVGAAVLAALLFGLQAPCSKVLLEQLEPLFLAALLYLGAGLGMLLVAVCGGTTRGLRAEAPLRRADLPFVLLMLLLDVAAPSMLLLGIRLSGAATASLLGNFEIVATAMMARQFFGENIGRRMGAGLGFICAASLLLSLDAAAGAGISPGAVLVLLSCLAWGLENNCTRMLSLKDPLQVVVIKGLGSGTGALVLAALWGEIGVRWLPVAAALVLGFVSYGLSIFFYVLAQRQLGAARTSAYYAAAPFLGVLLSWVLLGEAVTGGFVAALALMLLGSYFVLTEEHCHRHVHVRETHEHRHAHEDGHHDHPHEDANRGAHCHEHTHEETAHEHPHQPDLHHRHRHD